MATYDQNGQIVDDVQDGALDDVQVTAVRPRQPEFAGLIYALLAGVVVWMIEDRTTSRRRRRRR